MKPWLTIIVFCSSVIAASVLASVPLVEGRPLDGFTIAAVLIAIAGGLYLARVLEVERRRKARR